MSPLRLLYPSVRELWWDAIRRYCAARRAHVLAERAAPGGKACKRGRDRDFGARARTCRSLMPPRPRSWSTS